MKFHPEKMLIQYRIMNYGHIYELTLASQAEGLETLASLQQQHPGCLLKGFRVARLSWSEGRQKSLYTDKRYYSYGPLPLIEDTAPPAVVVVRGRLAKTTIIGDWSFKLVWVGIKELLPDASQKLYNHSPDGFNWGYGGSGPSQLALAILLDVTHDERFSVMHYQAFKREVIAKLPQDNFILPLRDVHRWLKKAKEKEHDADPS